MLAPASLRLALSTSAVLQSPEVQQVVANYTVNGGPTATPTASNTPAPPTATEEEPAFNQPIFEEPTETPEPPQTAEPEARQPDEPSLPVEPVTPAP